MTLPALVIFDCDGVLVDSEMIASRVLADYLTGLGLKMTGEDCRRRFTGMSIASVRALAEKDLGRTLDRDFEQQLRALDTKAFARDLRAVPGVENALNTLRVPFCIASSGSPEKISSSLRLTGLERFFADNIFSATQVANGKPAPDLFLFAADRMKATAEQTIVIEDSPSGVIAAGLAHMKVLGFTGASHAQEEPGYGEKLLKAGADQVFDDMASLEGLLHL